MKRLIILSTVAVIFLNVTSSTPICRSCSNNCYQNGNFTNNDNSTGTETDLLDDLEQMGRRQKREAEVEYRACSHFQVEMLLIPLSIAMIPIILCALIMCTCYCGPKESRGKLPDDFLSFPMSKKRNQLNSEEMELEFRDGYVQRKDSTRTKFSTVVSYIENRRESSWSIRTENGTPTGIADSRTDVQQEKTQSSMTVSDQLHKTPSIESIKKTRFSDTISVIAAESLCRR